MKEIQFEDNENIDSFKINQKYAKKYEHNKQRVELEQLKEKYGSDIESSSGSDEDENGELLDDDLDAKIMNTLELIKKKDPLVYNDTKFFEDEVKERQKKEKSMNILEYQRNQLLGKEIKTHVQEQEDLKMSFKGAVDSDDDELFQPKEPIKIKEQETRKESKQNNEKNSNKDDEFLNNYLLNKGWVNTAEVPLLSSDSEFEEEEEEYEMAHNFRFEEEGSSAVISHARHLPQLIRRPDTTRKEKRQRKLTLEEEKKLKKQEEIKRLKNLKKQEIQKKLLEIQKMAGGELQFQEIDLVSEFDPKGYDQRAKDIFNEDYYNQIDKKKSGKPKKPVFNDDIDISDIVPEDEAKKEENETTEKLKRYMDEYYQLDYEDIIQDQPVRFKYKQVEKNNYGLELEEILNADEEDLNELISLKKLAPYRSGERKIKDDEKWKKHKKKRLWEFRSKSKQKETEVLTNEEKRLKSYSTK